MLPVPTVADLSTFTDRPPAAYGTFAAQALTQATLLFTLTTRLTEMPDDPDKQMLARNAILQMADRIYLEQPHAATAASPFQSETIGSYSYSKGSSATANAARDGLRTGLFWWDLAIDELSAPGQSMVTSSSVSVFENEDMYDRYGRPTVNSPGQLAEHGEGFYNANTISDPRGR